MLSATPRGPLDAALVFAAMLVSSSLISRPRYPLHLTPLGRIALYVISPVLGAAIVVALSFADNGGVTAAMMVAPVTGAWLVTLLGVWVTHRFESERAVRIATIGEPRLAAGADLRAARRRHQLLPGLRLDQRSQG